MQRSHKFIYIYFRIALQCFPTCFICVSFITTEQLLHIKLVGKRHKTIQANADLVAMQKKFPCAHLKHLSCLPTSEVRGQVSRSMCRIHQFNIKFLSIKTFGQELFRSLKVIIVLVQYAAIQFICKLSNICQYALNIQYL